MELNEKLRAARLFVVSGDTAPERQEAVLRAAIDGGADLIELRNKTAEKGQLLPVATRLATYARERGALFIVNDHVDLAMAAGADGVHLGQDDLPLDFVRGVWPGRIVGRSTHSLEQALGAVDEGADYIAVGPVFATPTKPGRPAVGTDLLTQVAANVEVPWFAIGGIDLENIDDILAAGATRVVVVRAVCEASDPAAAAARLLAHLAMPVGSAG